MRSFVITSVTFVTLVSCFASGCAGGDHSVGRHEDSSLSGIVGSSSDEIVDGGAAPGADPTTVDGGAAPDTDPTTVDGGAAPTTPGADIGEMCGGVAALQCKAGLTCVPSSNLPDSDGVCQ